MSARRAAGAGPFVVDPERRLFFGGTAVALSRACSEVLIVLLEHAGAPVSEAVLLHALAGADREQGLHDMVATINRVLERHSRQCGYVGFYSEAGYAMIMPQGWGPRLRFAGRVEPLIGRERDLLAVGDTLARNRFVTIVGPGGIGKTSIAKAIAAERMQLHSDGCFLLDLAPIRDGRLLPALLATSIGMPPLHVAGAGDPAQFLYKAMAAYLRGRHVLVVMDSCEHLLEATALAAEALLATGAGIHVLATSREALRAEGESVMRLAPMGLPPAGSANVNEVLASPAVRLFARRACLDGALSPEVAQLVGTLCRKLDGLPLAIELAASLVATLGLQQLALQAGQRLISTVGRADGRDRHLSLRATLDWSYDLLSDEERTVFARLSLFRAGFTMDAASAVVADAHIGLVQASDIVIGLVAKSLVTVASGEVGGWHRLLDTTRAYAAQRFAAMADARPVHLAHARYLCTVLDEAHLRWLTMSRRAWLERYLPWLGDVRVALDWAFGPDGDKVVGVILMSTCFPLADQAGAMHEFGPRLDQALGALDALAHAPPLARMRLIGYGRDVLLGDNTKTSAHLHDALIEVASSDVAEFRGSPLSALWAVSFTDGDYAAALATSTRITGLARDFDDPVLALIGKRTLAQSLHFMGRHEEAKEAAREALDNGWRRIPLTYTPSPIDIPISMRIVMARILWMQGLPEQAAQLCAEALNLAAGNRPEALCQTLGLAAIPLALWEGDLGAGERLVDRLASVAARYSSGYWQVWAAGYREVMAAMPGPGRDAAIRARPVAAPCSSKQLDHFATFHTGLLHPGTSARIDGAQVGWCVPEVLRARAHLLLQGRRPQVDQAEQLLRAAVALAQRQGALAWELRSTRCLAALMQRQGRGVEARRLLSQVLGRYTEGMTSAAVRAAYLQLHQLQGA